MPRNGQITERVIPDLDRLPRPVLARVESLPAGSWARPHSHPWVQLSYAIAGVLGVRTASGNFFAPPQRAIWVPPGVEHEVLTPGVAEMRSLYIDPAAVPAMPRRSRVLEITPLVRELIRAMSGLPVEYDESGPDGRLAIVLLDQLMAMPEVALSLPLPDDPRLAAICAELQSRPEDRRTLSQWARTGGMSERTMTRLFRRQTGMSFREWRRKLRLLMAIAWLERGENVTKAALDSGYTSISAFIAAFKRTFGKTPGDFFQ